MNRRRHHGEEDLAMTEAGVRVKARPSPVYALTFYACITAILCLSLGPIWWMVGLAEKPRGWLWRWMEKAGKVERGEKEVRTELGEWKNGEGGKVGREVEVESGRWWGGWFRPRTLTGNQPFYKQIATCFPRPGTDSSFFDCVIARCYTTDGHDAYV